MSESAGPSPEFMHMSEEERLELIKKRRQERHQRRVLVNRRRRRRSSRVGSAPPLPKFYGDYPRTMTHSLMNIGHSATKGKRPDMEDKTKIDLDENMSIIGLFDGHIGKDAAKYAAQNMSNNIRLLFKTKCLKHQKKVIKEREFNKLDLKTQAKYVVYEAFKETTPELHKKKIFHGTCASVLVFIDKLLVASNVGDSKIVLYTHSGEEIQLSEDHNLKNESEKKRVVKEGANINNGRVGLLNVTRAIGSVLGKLVIDEPYQTCLKIDPKKHKCIIMGCDGFWDFVDRKNVAKIIDEIQDPKGCSEKLLKLAENKSTDNISVVVIRFK